MSVTSIDASQSADSGLPSRLFSAREVGEFALQKIGAYTPMYGAADPTELDRAVQWMELAIAQLHGRKRLQWLIPATLEFDLEDDTASYVLSDIAGSSFPSRRIAYPISATVKIDDGAETPVDLIRRQAFEDITTKDTTGTPDRIYIDRNVDDPVIYTYPVKTSDSTTATMRIVCETYAPSVLGPSADPDQAGNAAHGFEAAWQLWLINATAFQIGNGPVRQIGREKLGGIKVEMDGAEIDLMARNNRENQSMRLRRTRRYGG